jgi:hypothetical protein
VAEDLFRKIFAVESDPMIVQEINPLLKMKGIAVNEHAVHIEDCGGGQRVRSGHVSPVSGNSLRAPAQLAMHIALLQDYVGA